MPTAIVRALVSVGALGALATSALAQTLVDSARRGDGPAALALLAEAADVDRPEADGTRALHWAVYHGDVELVSRLVAAGADVESPNDYGATPLSEAAVRGDVEILATLLMAGADPNAGNADGQTPLMVVGRTENVAAARLLVEHGADVDAVEQRKGQTALMWAAAQSLPAMVGFLVEAGADIEARSIAYDWQRRVTAEPRTKDITPGGFTPLLFAARQGCLACVRTLVAAGADFHATNPEGISPLLMALLNAHYDTAEFLVASGADVNQWDRWGRTPLYAAVDYHTLPIGGRPDRPPVADLTGLATVELLLAAGANPNAQLKLFPPYRSLRADRGADGILDIGTTPLIRAAKAGDVETMHRLLEHGALVDLPQIDGITALMAASGMDRRSIDTRGKFTSEAELLLAVRQLLDAGADVAAMDGRGRTALHAAASQGMNDVVVELVEHGADPAVADADGLTPTDAARGIAAGRRGAGEPHPETVALLESFATPAALQQSE